MRFLRQALTGLALLVLAAGQVAAQDPAPIEDRTPDVAVPADGGATQTLEDILRRQRGETVSNAARKAAIGDPDSAAAMANQLGTLGGASDGDVWRQIRFREMPEVSSSSRGPAADTLIQDGGMRWLEWRSGPILTYGSWLLAGVLALLVLFYLVRGRIRIHGAKTGRTIVRFNFVERFAHWLTAGSFVLLAITGLIEIFGRPYLIPAFGREIYADLAALSKWTHNSVSWAFMLGLVLIFVFWVLENIPNRHDMRWMAMAGGIFGGKKHPPAKKFNAGQKMIFWAVVILGISISLSGLALLFPFRMPMFADSFGFINDTGLPGALGFGPLPTDLAPHEEMQYSQAWHAIVGFIFTAIIIVHIYIGTVGMEGAYAAMGSGRVEETWAREHHNLWVEDMERKGRVPADPAAPSRATPAE